MCFYERKFISQPYFTKHYFLSIIIVIVFLVRRRSSKGIHSDIKCGFLRLILHWSKDRYKVPVIQGIMWSMQEIMRYGALCVTLQFLLTHCMLFYCISLCWSSKLSLFSKLSNKFYVTFCYGSVMLTNVAKLMLTSLKLLLLLNHNIHIVASIFLALSRCTDNSF